MFYREGLFKQPSKRPFCGAHYRACRGRAVDANLNRSCCWHTLTNPHKLGSISLMNAPLYRPSIQGGARVPYNERKHGFIEYRGDISLWTIRCRARRPAIIIGPSTLYQQALQDWPINVTFVDCLTTKWRDRYQGLLPTPVLSAQMLHAYKGTVYMGSVSGGDPESTDLQGSTWACTPPAQHGPAWPCMAQHVR